MALELGEEPKDELEQRVDGDLRPNFRESSRCSKTLQLRYVSKSPIFGDHR